MKELVLAIFFIFAAIFLVSVSIAFGWFLVLKLLVKRFRFVRELFQIKDTSSPSISSSSASLSAADHSEQCRFKSDSLSNAFDLSLYRKKATSTENEEENKENKSSMLSNQDSCSSSCSSSSQADSTKYSPATKSLDKPRPNPPAHKLHLD